MLNTAILSDDELSLVPFEPVHVSEAYVGWLNDQAVVGETEQAGHTHTLTSVQAYVEATQHAPDAVMWRILKDGQHVGNLRISSIHSIHRRASIGLIIGDAGARGCGLGPRAIALASDHAFEVLAINKLFAGMFETNLASRKAFEKAGYRPDATLRAHAWHQTRFVDVHYLARFRAQGGDG